MPSNDSPVATFLGWLEREVPSLFATLAPPADDASLEALVDACGAVPEAFIELYRAHDGQVGEDFNFVPYHYLLDAREVAATWKDQQTYDAFTWKRSWVPFARFDCDYLCLDAETGSVIVFFLKFADRPVIANSFVEFLVKLRRSVETGAFLVTEDGLEEPPHAELAWTAVWERECASPPRRT